MNSIQLKNFKAFLDPVQINFDDKNALIYGENGAGKSSVYEAIKLLFHTAEVYRNRLDATLSVPQDIRNAKDDILNSYNHQSAKTTRFTLAFNGTAYSELPIAGYNVSMISRDDIMLTNKINVSKLLENSLVGISNLNNFITNNKDDIEIFLNEIIRTDFCEGNISIELFHAPTEWLLKVKDNARSIERTDNLDSYFNEGKLHVIILLLLLISVQLNGARNRGDKLILVLDDIITSLDAANRTFFVKYLRTYFGEYQKVILTHSISFYNQLNYSFRIVWGQDAQWKPFHIVEHSGKSVIEEEHNSTPAIKIRKIFDRCTGTLPVSMPNDIRKRFEYLVLEFSKLFYIGGISECGKILNKINAPSKLYYKVVNKKSRTIYDMVDEIIAEIGSSATCTLKTNLEGIVTAYDAHLELPKLRETLQELMIYQKVTMHAGSHAVGSLSSITQHEMDRSITLLQNLEQLMNGLIGRDMYSI